MKNEIFKILPAYNKLPRKEKYTILMHLKAWCELELKDLPEEMAEHINLLNEIKQWQKQSK